MLHRLELGDWFPELLAFARVLDRVVQRALREPDHLRADGYPSFVQRLDGRAIALANFAEDICARHLAVLEQQLARAACPDPELVFLLADRKPGEVALD